MGRYLIDANLPYYFSLWKSENYQHVFDIDDCMDDSKIWMYATTNNLTIITKDSDFSNRILLKTPPPKVIHLRIGNLRMNDLFNLVSKVWEQVEILSTTHKLVNVYQNRIEAIN